MLGLLTLATRAGRTDDQPRACGVRTGTYGLGQIRPKKSTTLQEETLLRNMSTKIGPVNGDTSTGERHLSQLSTLWSVMCQAHQGPEEAMRTARQRLLERYGGAVRRYLAGAVRERDAGDELFQEFALRFLRGDFRNANPERGRFRSFLKTALFRLVVQYRRRRLSALPLREDAEELADYSDPTEGSDQAFLFSWRDELLARAWNALERVQDETGQPFYVVLRFRADHTDIRSPQMAEQLNAQLGKPLTAGGVRQILHRARDYFAAALLDEVVHSLETPTQECLEDELLDLGLLDYCRPALKRRGSGEAPA
jgi:RNA polymerase sigma-70 factor (ECF subfamily)